MSSLWTHPWLCPLPWPHLQFKIPSKVRGERGEEGSREVREMESIRGGATNLVEMTESKLDQLAYRFKVCAEIQQSDTIFYCHNLILLYS